MGQQNKHVDRMLQTIRHLDSLSNLRGQRTGFESLRFRLATNLGEPRIKPWKVYT
jgi:hypothetical protein